MMLARAGAHLLAHDMVAVSVMVDEVDQSMGGAVSGSSPATAAGDRAKTATKRHASGIETRNMGARIMTGSLSLGEAID